MQHCSHQRRARQGVYKQPKATYKTSFLTMMKNLFKRGSQATATQGVPVKEATPRKTGLR